AEATGGPDCVDQLVQYDGWLFFTRRDGGLVPDGVNTTVYTVGLHSVVDLLGWITIVEVDRLGTNALGDIQSIRLVVDDEDSAGALQQCRVGGHLANRAGTIDSDRFTGFHTGQFGRVVSGREDIRQHGEIFFVLIAFR